MRARLPRGRAWGQRGLSLFYQAPLTCMLLAQSPAAADIFHLSGGGRIDGELVRQADDTYHIRTVVGEVRVAADRIERVEPRPSVFVQYAQRRAETADTAAAHTALADWCGDLGLHAARQRHLRRAVELDADHAAARRALGYVKVAGRWVTGRIAEDFAARVRQRQAAATADERLRAAIEVSWRQDLLTIRRAMLESGRPASVEKGQERIRAIDDPNAILPMTEVLTAGDAACRELLVEALRSFEQDEATVALVVIALVDPVEAVRSAALTAMAGRAREQVIPPLREALYSGDEVLIRRAATALGRLEATSAVPELITLLIDRQHKWAEVPHRPGGTEWLTPPYNPLPPDVANPPPPTPPGVLQTDAAPLNPRWIGWNAGQSGHLVLHGPDLPEPTLFQQRYYPVYDVVWRRAYGPTRVVRGQQWVRVQRTEVLEALRAITGQPFGFEPLRWWNWYEMALATGTGRGMRE